jgi:DNA-binding beta-propeller fold protein YncE
MHKLAAAAPLAVLALAAPVGIGGARATAQAPGALLTPLPTLVQPDVGPVRDLVFDAGGRHLYATGSDAVPVYASLARDAGTGTLGARHAGTCVRAPGLSGRSCRQPAEIVLSPDGRNGYVLGNYTYVSAVTTLTRSRAGVLAPTDKAIWSLGNAVRSLAISPDGRNLYVAVDSGLVALDRDRRGRLALPKGERRCYSDEARCRPARGVVRAAGVTVSADGRSLYLASEHGVAIFRRNRHTGVLRQLPGQAGCIAPDASSGCATGRAVGGSLRPAVTEGKISGRRIVVSDDGRRVYAASSAGIAVFARSTADGSLRQLAGAAGCVSSDAASGCTQARALRVVEAIALSPDGATLYATARVSGSLVVLERDAATRGLVQPAGEDGCVNATGIDGCTAVPEVKKPFGLAVSPDGRHVYLGTLTRKLLGFARRPQLSARGSAAVD